MKSQKKPLSKAKQLAFELGECRGQLAGRGAIAAASAAEPDIETTPSNIICFRSEVARQEQAERGMYYANIMALAKHLG